MNTRLRTILVVSLISGGGFCAQAQSLPVTTGLQLWLKADVGVTTNSTGLVTNWADQSGNGNNATQSDPTKAPSLVPKVLNGHAVLNFPGDTTRFLDVADSASIAALVDNVTILVVAEYDDLKAYRCVVSKTLGNKPAPFDWWNNQAASAGATTFWLGDGTTFQGFTAVLAPRTGVYNVLGFTWSNGALAQFVDQVDNGRFTYTVTPGDGGTPLRIGSRDDLVTQLKGNLAEVLVYQPALSDSDRTSVIGYLRDKFALTFAQPPVVSLITPTNGSTLGESSVLPVSVSASPTGIVARVDLLVNGTLLASSTQAPYQTKLALPNPGLLTLSAVATATNGLAATSAPVSITVTGAAPATPATTGLSVWLRADAGVTTNGNGLVTGWADQSGSGNNAAQADPTVAPLLAAGFANGRPALRFGTNQFSTNQFLDVPDAGTAFTAGDFSTFVVARFANFNSYRALWAKTSGGVAGPFDWWFSPGGGVPNVYRGDGVNFGGPIAGTHSAPVGAVTAVGVTAQGQAVTHYLGFNANGAGRIAVTPVDAGLALRIGARDEFVTRMEGDIAEILIYNHALSDADRSNTVSYLSSRFGLAQAISADQPPVVSITSPTNTATFAAPTTIPVVLTASDADGTVARVDLLANGLPLASLTNSPYQINIDLVTPGTVTFTAVATDNWGIRSTSAPVVLTVSGAAVSSPVTNGLALWLKADAGVHADATGAVTEWDDQSGLGNNALQSASPTGPLLVTNVLGGKPAVRFDGSGQYLEVANAPSVEFTNDIASYALVRFDDFGTYRAIWAKTAANQPASVDYYVLPGSGIPRFYRGNGTGSAGSVDGAQPLPAGTYLIDGFEMAGTTATHYLNGGANGGGPINATIADGGTPLKIGTRDDLVTKMKGDIAELLVFSRALSSSERSQVFNYLSSRYGLPLVRVANRPPVVTLTSPTNTPTLAVPALLNLAADASDPDSAIARVDFLANGSVIASQTVAPYQVPVQVLTPGALTLQARATTVGGATSLSAPVAITGTGTSPVSAPPKANLVLWLKADTGVTTNGSGGVTAWADQSGLGNNAAPPDPSFGPSLGLDLQTGRPVLKFDGTQKYLDAPGSTNLTLGVATASFFAASFADFSTYRSVWGKTTVNQPRPWDFYVAPGGVLQVWRGNSDGVSGVSSTVALPAKQFLFGGFSASGALGSLYFDGQMVGTGSFDFGALDGGTELRIGSRDDLATQFAGNLGEVLVYNQALSSDDLQTVNTYLAGRYGLVLVQVAKATQPALTFNETGAGTVLLTWPLASTGLVLESSASLGGGWSPIATNPPGNQVTIKTTNTAQYYRLRSP